MNTGPTPSAGLSVATLLVAAVLVHAYFQPLGGSDHYWQVATGRLIVQSGDLHPPESFTYTAHGRALPDHEWLYEVVAYAADRAFGEPGLALLKVLLIAAPLVAVGWRMRVESVPAAAMPAVLIALVVSLPMWSPRPLWVSNLGLLLAAGWLRDTCAGRRTRAFDWRLPVLYLVWANSHPAVIAGQALLAGAVAWEWLNRAVRFNPPLPPGALRRLTATGILALAASLAGPDPVGRLLYPFSPEVRHPIMRHFGELLPAHQFAGTYPLSLGVLAALVAVVAAAALTRPRAVRGWEWALLGCTLLLAAVAFRGVTDCVLVWLVVGVPVVAARLESAGLVARLAGLREAFARPLLRWQPRVLAAALATLVVVAVVPPLNRALPRPADPEYPAAAADWLATHLPPKGEPARIFSIPEHGSYLIGRLGERVRVYADSRGFYLPPEVIADAVLVPALAPDWRKRLDRVLTAGTDYFLLEVDGPRGRLWRELAPALSARPLHADRQAVILSRAQVQAALGQPGHQARGPNGAAPSPLSPLVGEGAGG
ncbi:MAG: hypothetical protein IT429_12315 [Gemmataceae bacterium]|nr:hypothetical protein [Gemmataceae bacterium]